MRSHFELLGLLKAAGESKVIFCGKIGFGHVCTHVEVDGFFEGAGLLAIVGLVQEVSLLGFRVVAFLLCLDACLLGLN